MMRGNKAMERTTTSGWRRRLRGFRRARAGSVAVEAAFGMTLIMIMLLPMVDFGRYISLRLTLKQALRAGGQYVLHDLTWKTDIGDASFGTATLPGATTTAITSTVRDAAGLNQTLTVTTSDLACYCPEALTTAVSCLGESGYSVCPDDGATASQDESGIPGHYLTIVASGTFDPFLTAVPWFSASTAVSERLVLRIN